MVVINCGNIFYVLHALALHSFVLFPFSLFPVVLEIIQLCVKQRTKLNYKDALFFGNTDHPLLADKKSNIFEVLKKVVFPFKKKVF